MRHHQLDVTDPLRLVMSSPRVCIREERGGEVAPALPSHTILYTVKHIVRKRNIAGNIKARFTSPGIVSSFSLAELAANLVLVLASGKADSLSGCFISTSDDIDQLMMRSEQIEQDDLYSLRLRKL